MKSLTESINNTIITESRYDIEMGQQTITLPDTPKRYAFVVTNLYSEEIWGLQFNTPKEAADYFGVDADSYVGITKLKVGESHMENDIIYCRIH